MMDKKVVDTARGQALADEFGIKFFETSAKNNINVEKAFFEIARDVTKGLAEKVLALAHVHDHEAWPCHHCLGTFEQFLFLPSVPCLALFAAPLIAALFLSWSSSLSF
jgi:hypothetical protein